MRAELPVCRRCCFCLPLRYGLLLWGYLKLIINGLFVTQIFMALFVDGTSREGRYVPPSNIVLTSVVFMAGIIDFIFNIILLIGCHKKNLKLLKIYYYYSLVVIVLTLALGLYNMGLAIQYIIDNRDVLSTRMLIHDVIASLLFIANLALQFYIILLIRSQVIKIKGGGQFKYVNNATEPQCTLNHAGNIDSEKETACEKKDENDGDINVCV